MERTPKSPPPLDYAGGEVPVAKAGPVVGAFVFGVAAIFLSLLIRAGLHNELNPLFLLPWLAVVVAATNCVQSARRHGAWLDGRPVARRFAITIVALGWLGGFVGIFFPSGDPHASDTRMQGRCSTNFERVAFAIETYTMANGGRYPDDLAQLLRSGDAYPESLICPSTRDKSAEGETPGEVADAFVSGGHCSYIYVGKGLTTATITRGHVILYEPARNHTRDHPGIHVLWGNGKVVYLQSKAARDFLERLGRGENPPSTK